MGGKKGVSKGCALSQTAKDGKRDVKADDFTFKILKAGEVIRLLVQGKAVFIRKKQDRLSLRKQAC
jgi:hypothetical protein